jgi:hypothetical protein
MASWKAAFGRALITGTTASVLSAAMLAICGRIERGTAAGPNNGPSQWIWGEHAAYERRATLRNTAVGYAIHHLMSIGWATLHEKHAVDPTAGKSLARRLAECAATSAFACFVDYRIAPRRLRPGFEKQLGKTSLFLVYAAFAVGLAAGKPACAALRAAGARPGSARRTDGPPDSMREPAGEGSRGHAANFSGRAWSPLIDENTDTDACREGILTRSRSR